jgi:hypothetical protein
VSKPFILPSKARKRGNPNWGKPMEPAPAVPTAFEEQVQKLGCKYRTSKQIHNLLEIPADYRHMTPGQH